MQVAVVGGGGFIGSHVVDHLVMAGHQVRVVDPVPRWRNPAARYYELDLFDGISIETKHGLRFVDRDQIDRITSTVVECKLTDEEAAAIEGIYQDLLLPLDAAAVTHS